MIQWTRLALLFCLIPWVWAESTLFMPPPPKTAAKAYFVIDATTGSVLAKKNEDMALNPASLTKLLTLYITADALKEGHIALDDQVYVSKQAWQTGGSRMFIQEGKHVSVEQLIHGVATVSGNDAAVALAEHIAGSTQAFVALMNETAKRLEMDNSHFANPIGLNAKDHYATAHDLARLASAWLKNFPEYYPWFSEKYFKFNGIKQPNRNRLLWRDPSVDGIKTGHTDEAGFCLISSAKRDATRIITVTLGSDSDKTRFQDTQQLLAYAFRFFATKTLAQGGKPLYQARIWQGEPEQIDVGVAEDLAITLNRYQKSQVLLIPHLDKLKAPIHKGDSVGILEVSDKDNPSPKRVTLVALQDSQTGSLWRQAIDWVKQCFH